MIKIPLCLIIDTRFSVKCINLDFEYEFYTGKSSLEFEYEFYTAKSSLDFEYRFYTTMVKPQL